MILHPSDVLEATGCFMRSAAYNCELEIFFTITYSLNSGVFTTYTFLKVYHI